MQRENGRAISIIKSYHLNTRDIPTRQNFQVTCAYTELNVVCSETCTTILKYPKEMPFVLIWKTGISCLSKPEETLEQGSELLCKCCRANKLLLKNYTGNDFRRLAIISRKKN